MEQNKAWHGKTGGGNFGQKSLFFYSRYGSINISYAIMSIVVPFFLIAHYRETKNIYNYFRLRFRYSILKSMVSVYQNHFLFGKTFVDKFAIYAHRTKDFRVEVDNEELFYQIAQDSTKGGILLHSHVGCSEIAGYLLFQKQKRINAIVYGGETDAVQEYRKNILAQQNVTMIPVTDGFSHIFAINNAFQNAELISMAGDRTYEGSKNIKCDFLGAPALFPTGAFQLAVRAGVPVVSLFVMQDGHKKYHCYVFKVEADLSQVKSTKEKVELLLKAYVETLEMMMKKYPLQWYNFHQFWL